MDPQELIRQCAHEQATFKSPIVFEMDITSAMVIVGALQLSLRHPSVAGSGRATEKIIRDFIFSFKDQLPEGGCKYLRMMIERGFHKRFDL